MSEGGVEIGALSGRLELEDTLSPALQAATKEVSVFDEAFGGLGKRMLEYTASFFTAETALKAVEEAAHVASEALKELVIEGSHAADIQTTFERMTKAAGLFGDEILGRMRTATHGMVSDLDLMREVNQMLAVGLHLTNDNFTTLAQGGFALAKKEGGDVTDALDKMSGAMTRGYVRSLLLLTGKIDLGNAEDKFAAQLDTTTAHLTEQGKQQAIAEEVLNRIGAATAKVGDEQIRLGDAVEQTRASWSNLNKDLGIAISNSATLNEGLVAAENAMTAAFGNKEKAIQDVALAIDSVAIAIVYYAKYVGDAYQGSKILWEAAKKDATMASEGITLAAIGVDQLAKGYLKLSEIATGADLSFPIHAMDVDIDRLYDNLSKAEGKIADWSQQQMSAAMSAGKWDLALQGIIDRMQAAKEKTEEHNDVQQRLIASFVGGLPAYEAAKKALGEQAAAQAAAAGGANSHSAAEEKLRYTMSESRAESEKYKKALEDITSVGDGWKGTVADMDQALVSQMQNYLRAGVSQSDLAAYYGHTSAKIKEQIDLLAVAAEKNPEEAAAIEEKIKVLKDEADKYSVTAAQIRDVAKAMEEKDKADKLAIKQTEASIVRWSDYNDLVVSMSGSTTDKINADVQKWADGVTKAAIQAQTDTADFYVWRTKMSAEMTDKEVHNLLLQNTNSKASFDQRAHDAANMYQFAIEHSDQYAQRDIDNYKSMADAARDAAASWEQTLGGTMDDLIKKSDALAEAMKKLTPAGQFDVTKDNFVKTLNDIATDYGFNPTGIGSKIDIGTAYELAKKGYSLQEILAYFNQGTLSPTPVGPRIPGFKEGGVGDFKDGTLAMLHGREAIVPLDGSGGGGFGATVVNIHPGAIVMNYPIMNDPRAKDQLASMIGGILVERARNLGKKIS